MQMLPWLREREREREGGSCNLIKKKLSLSEVDEIIFNCHIYLFIIKLISWVGFGSAFR
jgi:hypothetical protein